MRAVAHLPLTRVRALCRVAQLTVFWGPPVAPLLLVLVLLLLV